MGLGGFFDGIVLHQLLQWHQMLSSWYPLTSVEALKLNTFWDGVFHSATYLFVLGGLFVLWRSAQRRPLLWSGRMLIGSMLMGFGAFNLVEGTINHHILGIHHVNETVPFAQWIYWDLAFLAWGAAMLAGGWILMRSVHHQQRPLP
ncbi:membrane protein [Hyphomicrobium nitrativorans NL23]|uniref:Membrane protein n=1 Tax=Hyphomicrobium nitrativorans NL23 TaxID=1029756 RepID=V5SCE8_9HYPH|nr:membrane protein [Hyphomicrobium nitrativorans NL23]